MVRATRKVNRKLKGGSQNAAEVTLVMRRFLDDSTYDRMIDYETRNIDAALSYKEFYNYNKKLISEMPADDFHVLKTITSLISRNELGLMDEESCSIMDASNFFYNNKGKLVIANPR